MVVFHTVPVAPRHESRFRTVLLASTPWKLLRDDVNSAQLFPSLSSSFATTASTSSMRALGFLARSGPRIGVFGQSFPRRFAPREISAVLEGGWSGREGFQLRFWTKSKGFHNRKTFLCWSLAQAEIPPHGARAGLVYLQGWVRAGLIGLSLELGPFLLFKFRLGPS